MNKIKLTLLLFIFVTISILSCKKDSTSTQPTPTTSTLSLLTAKQWIFDSVYNNYTSPNTGILVYARGGNSNTVNLDNKRIIFWPDGKEDIFNIYSIYNSATWSFTDADSTKIYISFNGPAYQRILKLDDTHLNIYDSTGSALDIFIVKP